MKKQIETLIRRTNEAAVGLRSVPERQIKAALAALAGALVSQQAVLLKANVKDLSRQEPGNPRNDRLMLNEQRIRSIARGIGKVSRLPDPSGKILVKKILANGLLVEKISVP